ncbi:hypothetical protein Tco_1015553 [Tanacetum coccineum]|uniref:Uncharacterized protein n=1 Tax=Tanacetum coccineum TaxID=301880 RepID=A0ABQ5FM88_9ASTR
MVFHNLWVELLEYTNERQLFITELEGLCPSAKSDVRGKYQQCQEKDCFDEENQISIEVEFLVRSFAIVLLDFKNVAILFDDKIIALL